MKRISEGAHDFFLTITEAESGGIIDSADMALQFAKLILDNSKDEGAHKQLPLHVEDRGDVWYVQGNLNRDMKQPGWGPWEIGIRKRDAAVTQLLQRFNQNIPPVLPNES